MKRESWERREGETAREYAAFCKYRDALPHERSLLKVFGNGAGNVPGYFTRSCQKNQWVSRATEHDDHIDRISRQETEGLLKDALRVHASISKQAIETLEATLIRVLAALPDSPDAIQVFAIAGLAMRRWADVQLRGLGYLSPLDERGIVDGEALAQNLSRIRGEENARV